MKKASKQIQERSAEESLIKSLEKKKRTEESTGIPLWNYIYSAVNNIAKKLEYRSTVGYRTDLSLESSDKISEMKQKMKEEMSKVFYFDKTESEHFNVEFSGSDKIELVNYKLSKKEVKS